ncbi:ATP synthase subunit delta [Nonlabens sp. YIK11]|uniref:ATP synthase F1 subunit delta n=1 Tax=Nonlabens sp. YIK11 TaxID=1453349 RepID=UPI0006DC17C0|nr:ATP synthase F1 subunit delta [Nonlabens sp. YIK11]KQC32313.1 ATP synthase subunit delta [Nonlabens sp. YIK11]
MKLSRAASRYAKAILDLTIDKKEAAAVNEDMKSVLTTVHKNKELQDFLKSPVVKTEQKRGALRQVFSQVGGITMGAFDLIVDNQRADILSDIATKYILLFDEMNKREVATVTTAVEISKELEAKILAKATELAGKEITLEKKIDPSIVGGFILRVGDKEINASIHSTLGDLKREFAYKYSIE